jgi:D-tyrosyl-tRNA(Tyr) deacylase
MRAVVQRVHESSVVIDSQEVGRIGVGLLVLLGIAQGDDERDVDYLADKIVELRVFADEAGKMNRSLLEINGQMLVVSQFTLLGDCRKGRRPSFIAAAAPDTATHLYERFVARGRDRGIDVATGQFQAHMLVHLVNDGPVTLMLDSKKLF